ncbi:cytochrome P450 [Streptomyces luteireticuli]|uniref:cytochrome P450 n=1 Tax=Streptomyces luteireticuli TaxID=173858 RepID=UPI003558CD1D
MPDLREPHVEDIPADRHTATGANSRAAVALLSSIRSARGQADPYPLYAQLRSLGDAVPTPWGLLLTSYRACSAALRSRSLLTLDATWREQQGARWTTPASRELGRMLITLNPPVHTQQRRALGAVFDRPALQRLEPLVEHTTTVLLDRLADHLEDSPADFTAVVAEELPIITIGRWMGLPAQDLPLLRSCVHHISYAQELFPTAPQLAQADQAAEAMAHYFRALVRDRRRSPQDDAITAWLRAWDAHEPDRAAADEAVRSVATFMLMAGVETTSSLLNSTAWLMAAHPEQAHWLRRNPHAVGDAVEEVLRFDPPVQVCSRIARQDTVVGGARVREGQLVYVLVGSAHHDPASTDEAGRFRVDRGGRGPHLAFGGGVHYCLGSGLARLEAAAFLRAYLRRFPHLQLAAPPRWEPRMAFRRITSLTLR